MFSINRTGESFLPIYPHFQIYIEYTPWDSKRLLKEECSVFWDFQKVWQSSVMSEVLLPYGFNEF